MLRTSLEVADKTISFRGYAFGKFPLRIEVVLCLVCLIKYVSSLSEQFTQINSKMPGQVRQSVMPVTSTTVVAPPSP
jgi:hypothetical protein